MGRDVDRERCGWELFLHWLIKTKGEEMKNRVTPYEAGWFTRLVKTGIATELDALAAMDRVAQAAIDELVARRRAKRREKRRRNSDD